MKTYKWILVLGLLLILVVPAAGQGPDEGGGGEIPDIGQLYGDLYVILRNVNGVPMLDGNGCIQPISNVTESVTIETDGEPLVINAVAGEPFALPTYTLDGDLVECELTEDMATWVQGVDFGRLNLGRAPDEVINHAFDEAIKNMNAASHIGTDPVGRLVLTFGDANTAEATVKTIDSPAENLALYIKMMKDGHWITTNTEVTIRGGRPPDVGPPDDDGPSTEPRPVLSDAAIALLPEEYQSLGVDTNTNEDLTNEQLLLAASLLAAAADKTGNITLDKLVYINSIYGINQSGPRTIPGEEEGQTYFNFGPSATGDYDTYAYDRGIFTGRRSGDCADGFIWVLQPDLDENGGVILNHFETQCMEILGYDPDDQSPVNAVRFTNMTEVYGTVCVPDQNGDLTCADENEPRIEYDFVNNVRAFAQASDDALQVLEYIHNYKVPEVLYPEP